jgi:hypothetical protein
MNTTTKPLSKVNEKISQLASRILEIEQYEANDDFNTREGNICANIKVYEWLDEDDVMKYIKNRNLSSIEEDILEEFNETRLNGIYDHTCEDQVEYLKERYEGNCDLDNPYKEYNLYKRFYDANFKAYPLNYYSHRDKKTNKLVKEWLGTNKHFYEDFKAFSKRKINYPEAYLKNIRQKKEWEFKEWDRRSLINFECWQYGRRGGWFSICKNSELEDQQFVQSSTFYTAINELEGIEDNAEFNQILSDELEIQSKYKKEFIKEMEIFIESWTEKFEAIKYFVEEIEKAAKGFKECLVYQLTAEIDEFIADLNIDFSNCSIKIEDDHVITSLGVKVKLIDFKTAFLKVSNIFNSLKTDEKKPIKLNVAGYFVEYAKRIEDDILIKAGCHKFSLNNINSVING